MFGTSEAGGRAGGGVGTSADSVRNLHSLTDQFQTFHPRISSTYLSQMQPVWPWQVSGKQFEYTQEDETERVGETCTLPLIFPQHAVSNFNLEFLPDICCKSERSFILGFLKTAANKLHQVTPMIWLIDFAIVLTNSDSKLAKTMS